MLLIKDTLHQFKLNLWLCNTFILLDVCVLFQKVEFMKELKGMSPLQFQTIGFKLVIG